MKMNPVVHFEMPAEDANDSVLFQNVWLENQPVGPEMGNYVLVETDISDEKGMLKATNRINGGFADKNKDFQCPSVVISVDDMQGRHAPTDHADVGCEK